MSIYTKFGSTVIPVSKDGAWIVCKYGKEEPSAGHKKEFLQTELKADGGWDELEKALADIPEIKQDPEYGYREKVKH